jgi:hypothetical protein
MSESPPAATDLTRSSPREDDDDVPSLADDGAYQIPRDEIHPVAIADRLLRTVDDFSHLVEGEAKIDWLLKRDEKVKGGRQILGTAHMPKVQGDLNPCFVWMLARIFGRESDFLIILDKRYWLAASARLREILVYHELTHCIHKTDGNGDPRYDWEERPVWGLRGHDVEEFTAVVQRYGAWNVELESFRDALNAHAEATQISGGAPPVNRT